MEVVGAFVYNTGSSRKEAKMANTPKIGDTITTAKSGVSGVVQEVVPNASGSVRVRLEVNGQDRWTTLK